MTGPVPHWLPAILHNLKDVLEDLEDAHEETWEDNHDLYDRLYSVIEDVDSATIKLDQILKGEGR